MAVAYVKGGMPLEVDGYVETGGSDAYGSDEPSWVDVEVTDVCWYNTGKPVTERFKESLSAKDWEAITDAIYDANTGW